MSNSNYSCENATKFFGTSDIKCNNGDISVEWLVSPTTSVNTSNRAYQREKVSTRSWQQGIMRTVLIHTYAGIPEIHIRVITIDGNHRFELIDGQQRMRAIIDFLRNEYVLPADFVVDGCDLGGMNSEEIRDTYPKIYQRILNYRIVCKWYEDLTDQQTADLFISILNNVNDMKPQELRNAILGFYSNYVRDTARGNGEKGAKYIAPHPLFERYTKKVKGEDKEYLKHFSHKFNLAGRMETDEWLSSLIYFYKNGWKNGITQDLHHKWVEKIQAPTGEYVANFKDEKKINDILNFALEIMKKTPKEWKVKLNPMTSLMMVVYAIELQNRGYKINVSKFSPAFFDTYARWSDTSTKLYMNETTINGNQMKEFSDLFGGKNANAIGTIFKVLDKDWKGREEEVGMIQIDERETFTKEDILRKWREQDTYCFYHENESLDEEDIVGDHYIPRSWGIDAGGVTEYDNLVVCCKAANLQKLNMSGDEFIKLLKGNKS